MLSLNFEVPSFILSDNIRCMDLSFCSRNFLYNLSETLHAKWQELYVGVGEVLEFGNISIFGVFGRLKRLAVMTIIIV